MTDKNDAVKAWKCSKCGHIHYGDEPPRLCPVCGFKNVFAPVQK